MASPKFCVNCGAALAPGSHFCAQCGTPLDATKPATAPASQPGGAIAVLAPWLVLGAVLMVTLGYFIGQRGAPPSAVAVDSGAATADAPIVTAPDISSLSPEERVDRLFNRVMTLAAAGKMDSVQFFAPMAMNALAALMPLDLHRRYDLGLIQLTAGDAAAARAQADTMLQAAPTHLLALSLAMRAAKAENRLADARRLGERLSAAATAERAKRLVEYAEHAPDITEALAEAGQQARATPSPAASAPRRSAAPPN